MKPLRAAFVCVLPSPYQRDLLAALAARPEVDLRVFYLERAAPDSPWPEKPLAPYEQYLPGGWLGLGTRRVHANWPLPDLRSYQVVVLNTLMSVTAQILLRGRLRGQRWIFWGEKLSRHLAKGFGLKAKFHRWLTAPLHRAAALVGIGRWAKDDYETRFPQPRQFNIPYYCDLTRFLAQPRHQRAEDKVTFLFCGQMIARKGLDLLLGAFAALSPRAHLLLIGREAEWPALRAQLSPEVSARITYAGFQPPEELPRLFAQADVFVLPSRYDGWGVVVNQALGAGLPIVCSDQVGAGFDLVTEGVNGFRFAAGDQNQLQGALQKFLDDSARLDSFGEASRARAVDWRPESGATRWIEALQEIAS